MQELTAQDFTKPYLGPLAGKSSIIVFYADWCPHCKNYLASQHAEQLIKLIGEHPDFGVFKFEGSSLPEHLQISQTYFSEPIHGFPTFVMLKASKDPNVAVDYAILSEEEDAPRNEPQKQLEQLTDFAKNESQ